MLDSYHGQALWFGHVWTASGLLENSRGPRCESIGAATRRRNPQGHGGLGHRATLLVLFAAVLPFPQWTYCGEARGYSPLSASQTVSAASVEPRMATGAQVEPESAPVATVATGLTNERVEESAAVTRVEPSPEARALVEIRLSLKNIAINKLKGLESDRPGNVAAINGTSMPNSKEGQIDQTDVRHEEIQAAIARWERESLTERTVFMEYEIKDMALPSAIIRTNPYAVLFRFSWFRHRLDYGFVDTNRVWKAGVCLPAASFYDTPSRAAILGAGPADVVVSGDLSPPVREPRDAETIDQGLDYKMVTSKHWFQRALVVDASPIRKNLGAGTELYDVAGNAVMGSSDLTTLRSPFWYPFDRYQLMFKFAAAFPAEVTVLLNDIEDLDVVTAGEVHFLSASTAETLVFPLTRERPSIRLLLRVASALLPLLFLNSGISRRLCMYGITPGMLFLAFPVPKDVPVFCLQNILTLGFALTIAAFVELRAFGGRTGRDTQLSASAVPADEELTYSLVGR